MSNAEYNQDEFDRVLAEEVAEARKTALLDGRIEGLNEAVLIAQDEGRRQLELGSEHNKTVCNIVVIRLSVEAHKAEKQKNEEPQHVQEARVLLEFLDSGRENFDALRETMSSDSLAVIDRMTSDIRATVEASKANAKDIIRSWEERRTQ